MNILNNMHTQAVYRNTGQPCLKSQLIMLVIILCLSPGFYSSALAQSNIRTACVPAENEVSVYQHANYKGICSILPIGEYTNYQQMRMGKNSISSIRVGSKVQISACKIPLIKRGKYIFTQKKLCQTFTKSISSLKHSIVGNDKIKTIKVSRKNIEASPRHTNCKPGADQVAIYQYPAYRGNCRILNVGSYENSKRMNFKNDSISSIELLPNSKVIVYVCQHANYKGRCEKFTKSDSRLYDNKIGDNTITSLRVNIKR